MILVLKDLGFRQDLFHLLDYVTASEIFQIGDRCRLMAAKLSVTLHNIINYWKLSYFVCLKITLDIKNKQLFRWNNEQSVCFGTKFNFFSEFEILSDKMYQ